jgi:hypothetical protein
MIANSTPAFLWMSSAEAENSFINTPLARFLGVEDTALGNRWPEFIHPEDAPAVIEEFMQAQAAESVFTMEFRLRRHDGEYRWMIDTGTPRHSQQGEFLGYAGSLIDITERKHAEEALQERERLLRLVTDTMPAFVSYVDTEERYRFNNRIYEEWRGIPVGELAGMPVREVVGEETYAVIRPYIERALTGEAVTYETEVLVPHLGKVPHSITYAPDCDAAGKVRGFVVLGYDITEQKRTEAQIRASLAEKEVLLREIHHRVKGNLQVVSSLLNLQSRYVTEPAAQEVFRDSQNRVRAMALLHEQLYRSDDLAHVPLASYVQKLIPQLVHSYVADTARIRLLVDVDDVGVTLETAMPCGLMLNELVSNALKHGFPQGRTGEVSIKLRAEDGGRFVLRVSDTGVGLPPHFDIHHAATMGMQLVHTLVEQLHGTLHVEDGPGTTIEIRFGELDYPERI